MRHRKKNIYDYRGYEGQDVSLEISLFEYGLIWKEVKKGVYRFIYGVDLNHDGYSYITFDWADLGTDPCIEFSWVDWDDVYKYTGTTPESYKNLPFPQIVADLIGYYGCDNVFGEPCCPFEITGNNCVS